MFFLILFLSIKCFVKCGIICEMCAQNYNKSPICEEGPANNCFMYEKLLIHKDKEEILDKINSRRNKVASGMIRSLPAAENMMRLEWSDKLAYFAQRWADQCLSEDVIDECSGMLKFGQNIGTVYGEAPTLSLSTLVDLWYMELLSVNANIISNYQPSKTLNLEHYEYFTQLIWANTREVGCGAAKFQESLLGNKSRTVHRLVCNFLPGGNIDNERVYTTGKPCRRHRNGCDSKYTSLCGHGSNIFKQNDKRDENKQKVIVVGVTTHLDTCIEDQEKQKSNNDTEIDISFDLYAHLFNVSNEDTTTIENTTVCKDVLAIDEFVDLLRKKLSTDNVFRDLLITQPPVGETQYTDPKVDAIVSKIYSINTQSTTIKPTDGEVINSTLLADLVEAVIFRNRDKISTLDVVFPSTEVIETKTVQMHAELGEIQRNLESTGHYFFPESEDDEQNDSTESYYDQSDLPVSEIIMELEELKRKQQTKDFVEEILESDTQTNTITQNHIITSDNNMNDTLNLIRNKRNVELWKYLTFGPEPHSVKRDKRSNHRDKHSKNVYRHDKIMLGYDELLKLLATDLKKIKLNSKFHCSHSSSSTTASIKTIAKIYYFVILFVY